MLPESMFQPDCVRIENNVDSICDNPTKKYVSTISRRDSARSDKEGDPVYVGRNGAAGRYRILKQYGKDEMIRHAIWMRAEYR
jgi:hypothetical protein